MCSLVCPGLSYVFLDVVGPAARAKPEDRVIHNTVQASKYTVGRLYKYSFGSVGVEQTHAPSPPTTHTNTKLGKPAGKRSVGVAVGSVTSWVDIAALVRAPTSAAGAS